MQELYSELIKLRNFLRFFKLRIELSISHFPCLKLWNRFINRDVSEESPTDVDFFNSWKETATSNSQKYEDVFRTAPNNTITNFAELGEYQGEQEPLNNSEDTFEEAIEKLQSIEGVLIDYPLEFLKDEWYHPDTFGGKEALAAPLGTFT